MDEYTIETMNLRSKSSMRVDILICALKRISNFGNGNRNRPWVRALHQELIDIAEKALEEYHAHRNVMV